MDVDKLDKEIMRSRFFQAVAIFVLAFLVLRFGIHPPAPWSVLSLYLFIIGLALLIGLPSKNAILIVEFAKARRDRGQPAPEAADVRCVHTDARRPGVAYGRRVGLSTRDHYLRSRVRHPPE